MTTKSKKAGISKRWYQLWKRFFAMVLSVCIIGGQLLPGMSVIAYASSELTNEDLGKEMYK